MHNLQKISLYWKAGGISDDGVDTAFRAKRGVVLVHPITISNEVWLVYGETIKTAA
jgi:hypothetical protein